MQCSGLNPTATVLEKIQRESFTRVLSELKNVKLKGRAPNGGQDYYNNN